jgi:hypothetical protein
VTSRCTKKCAAPKEKKMKLSVFAVSTAALALASLASAQYTTEQIATQHFYGARQGLYVSTPAQVPAGMAFTGDAVWVAGSFTGQLINHRPSDGTVLASYNLPIVPYALAWDGQTIWTASFAQNNVGRVRTDGSVVSGGLLPAGACLSAKTLTFDGQNMWVACPGSSAIYRIQAFPVSANPNQAKIVMPAAPAALAFDGTRVWVGMVDGSIALIDAAGNVTFPAALKALGAPVWSLVFDGVNMWAGGPAQVVQIPAAALLPAAPLPVSANVMVTDGNNVWAAGIGASLARINIASRTVTSVPVKNFIGGLTFDGADVWATFGDGTLGKF